MPNTNMNTTPETVLSSDIYDIAELYNTLRRAYVSDVSETASVVGIYGYLNDAFSQSLQNTIIAISESTNEMIPTRAKFSKNVIAHALNMGVNDINAKPAVMTLMIYLPITYMENNFSELNQTTGKAKFILSSKVPIFIDNHEYHLDYDVIITRVRTANNQYSYTAMYDLFETGTTTIKQNNPISDITNPYITTIIQSEIEGVSYIAFSARLHQVFYIPIEKNILTDNSIENKTITFDFSDNQGQLASFDVAVTEGNKVTHLTPVYNGLLDYTIEDGGWCYYEYISEKTIRIIFSRDSFVPGLNALVTINLYLTNGASGNFTYNQIFRTALKSEEYNNYNGMYALIYPLLEGRSSGGKDKKSISDLKKIIPREASSRGAIINTTDLENFFNSINDDECRVFFKKKTDNQFERMYYAYMVMKKDGNVYPTNTINLKIAQSSMVGHSGTNNLSINPGTVFYYYDHGSDKINNYATLDHPTYADDGSGNYHTTLNKDGQLVRVFEYISPFLITIDQDLISSFLLTIMNENKTFRFESINTSSDLQFITTNMQWVRKFYYKDASGRDMIYDNKYTMTVNIAQNNMADYKLITYHYDANGEVVFDDIRVKMVIVLYSDGSNAHPYRYAEAELIGYDASRYTYSFQFTFTTDDLMDLNNRIHITGVYNAKPEVLQFASDRATSSGYMNKNTYAKIFIMADFGIKTGDTVANGGIVDEDEIIIYGEDGIGNRTEIESLIPMKHDIEDAFLNDNISVTIGGQSVTASTVMRSNSSYMAKVYEYNGDTMQDTASILRYLKNNRDSDFVQNTLLKDATVQEAINQYLFQDYSRYTVCNTISVNDGIDFYHDYSNIMHTMVTINPIQQMSNGEPVYQEVQRYDSSGTRYNAYEPIYVTSNGKRLYQYTMSRFPVIKNGYLFTEELIQDFIYALEERRKYITQCLYVLEDTFDIDFKFVNTFGPSKTFYYNIPSATNYRAIVTVQKTNVYASNSESSTIQGELYYNQEIIITNINGQWGQISSPYAGYIKLVDTAKIANYIDNVAIRLKFALEAQTTADRYIGEGIIGDIKTYIEDINSINEIHMPNIITFITNQYREQLVYFEFLDLNGYGNACQHLYLETINDEIADIPPEFINIACAEDNQFKPMIDITVY